MYFNPNSYIYILGRVFNYTLHVTLAVTLTYRSVILSYPYLLVSSAMSKINSIYLGKIFCFFFHQINTNK